MSRRAEIKRVDNGYVVRLHDAFDKEFIYSDLAAALKEIATWVAIFGERVSISPHPEPGAEK